MDLGERNIDFLTIEGSATLRTIDTFHEKLVAALKTQAVTEIDCTALTEADLSLIQVLVAARKSAELSGRTLTLSRPASGILHDTLVRAGFLTKKIDSGREEDAFWLKGVNDR